MESRKLLPILFVALVLVQSLVVLSVQVPTIKASPGADPPKHIHLTFQGDPASTVTVTWQTNTSAVGDVVLYDTVSRGGDPSLYGYSVLGSHHTYSGASGYIHTVELTSLDSNTTYYFVCGGLGNYSEERSFRTAPRLVSDFKFVVGGDSRTDADARARVSEAMRRTDPSFVMHSGDMVGDGWRQGQWDSWFSDVNDNWIGDNGLTIPVIPCLGNHEENATNYYKQFALPGNEQWYYYDWGPNLRVIVLNSEASSSQISVDQVKWLRRILYLTSERKWRIVMFHRNVYYSGAHLNATDLMQYWVPVFDRYHVDIVVQGHTHHYHRSKPMKNHSCVSSYDEGTMYLTSGGWGAPLINYVEQPYSAYGNMTLHFTLVSVYQNGTLRLEAKDVNGYTFDEVRLYKTISDEWPQYRPPEAEAGEDRVVDEDTVVTLDGANSLNSTEVESYAWTFVDVTPQTLLGASVEYNFTNPGTYVITLNVTDAAGNFSTDTVTVTVYDITAPVADAGRDQTVKVNTQVVFNASGSRDNVGIVSYEWDFGDETTGTGVSTNHTYTTTGEYTVTLTVTDAAGNSDTDTVTITLEAEQVLPTWAIVAIGVVALVMVAAVYRIIIRKPS